MPSLKEVRNRITSVNSTQQITKAMKMVSAAKLRRAQDLALKIRPYADKLNGILQNISASLDENSNSVYADVRPVKRVLIVVITSDRGLAGAFNNNILKATNALIQDKYSALAAAGNVDFICIGKKGAEILAKRYTINSDYVSLFHELKFDRVKPLAETIMYGFVEGTYDQVDVLYNEFKNVVTQIPRTVQFLPITGADVTSESTASLDYIFEPSKEAIVEELIPKSLKIAFYKFLLESNASEHAARMSAMDKATDNAKELLKELKLTYNRSRQASITKEILEIVGGAEALNS